MKLVNTPVGTWDRVARRWAAAALCLLWLALPAAVAAQSEPAETEPDSVATATEEQDSLQQAMAEAQQGQTTAATAAAADQPFYQGMDNTPMAGGRADVNSYSYYGDWKNTVKLEDNGQVKSRLTWSWEDYRKQDKTTEKRDANIFYSSVGQLPFMLNVSALRNWSEDNSVNRGGYANQAKRDYQSGSLSLTKSGIRTGWLSSDLRISGGLDDQKGVTQTVRNDFSEAKVDGFWRAAVEPAEGVTVATRLYGKTASGDRSLGNNTSPSSTAADTVGLRVYIEKPWATSRVAVTRANFDQRYLDFKRNSTGLVDTIPGAGAENIVREVETKDAISLEFDNDLRLGRFHLGTNVSRDMDDQDFAANGLGRKERQQNSARLRLAYGAPRDSFAATYGYLYKWDDQRIKNATVNRGRQVNKVRDVDLYWAHRLFRASELSVMYHTGLSQDIAQDQFNQNDKDRLRSDLTVNLDREWRTPDLPRSELPTQVNLLFAYKKNEDLSIRSIRSANNNIQESYEIAPGYNWRLQPWLVCAQTFRVYIQYTDYIYSDLDDVNKNDNYNKRANLNTRVTIEPTKRLKLTVLHDYNKRFNATRTQVDAAGNSYYFTDQRQQTSKIDLDLKFKPVEGVILEAKTYYTLDEKERFAATTTTSDVRSGRMSIGGVVSKRWVGPRPLELSATVRKINARGPSVTDISNDFWEADIWLKWEF